MKTEQLQQAKDWLAQNNYDDNQYVFLNGNSPHGVNKEGQPLESVLANYLLDKDKEGVEGICINVIERILDNLYQGKEVNSKEIFEEVYNETFNTKEKMTPKEKAQDLWLRYYELIDDDYSNEAAKKMAKEYAQIAVDEIMKSLDDVLHPNPFGQYWNKVKQEIENL